LFDWPGLGDVSSDPRVQSFDDLVRLVLESADETPVDLVAQSMGGVIAMRVALERPEFVRRMVLVATSGGIDLSRFDLEDWRPEYRNEFPNALPFVTEAITRDLSGELVSVQAPTLLLWASSDRISPPEVGRHLASLLRNSQLLVLDYADHSFARDHAAHVAPLILEHLNGSLAVRHRSK
jgi:pimeloyl-ACP methyl ester carboxylesterase